MDAVFFVGQGHTLGLPAWYPVARMEDHLVQCLLRNPHDLTCHVRRVHLWLNQPGFDGLAAALTDLFLVLGPNGTDLRQRLLAQADGRLPVGIREFLRATSCRPPVDMPHSLFCRGPAYPGGPDVIRESMDPHRGPY